MANKSNDTFMSDLSLNRIAQYLYEVTYTDWDYSVGSDYCEKYRGSTAGACSSVRNGNLFGRNLDWYYDESASFIVHCNPTDGRHCSIGVAGNSTSLTDEIANADKYNVLYKVLPFLTVDGINDAGVVCNVNVVPTGDKGHTTGTNPNGDDLWANMLVRYVLDYADSASHAIELLKEKNIIMPMSDLFTQEFHWMIADKDSTYVVEFVDNKIKIISDVNDDGNEDFVNGKPIMTNFYLSGFDGNTSTNFYKSETYDPDQTTLTRYSAGVERFDLLTDGYIDSDTKRGMIELMKSVNYTKAYEQDTDPFWYSEFVGNLEQKGYGDLTIDSDAEDFTALIERLHEIYEDKQRNGALWQTVHTSVFDITEKKMWVISQEGSDEFAFAITQEKPTTVSGTPYDVFTKHFLDKVEEYKFIQLPTENRTEIVDGYMKRACAQFKKICKYDIATGDDDNRVFPIEIDASDIDEIADIISEGMLVQWMKPYMYKQENLENMLNTTDYNGYSPAELLYRITAAYKMCKKDFSNLMKEYSYNHGDLTDLHL